MGLEEFVRECFTDEITKGVAKMKWLNKIKTDIAEEHGIPRVRPDPLCPVTSAGAFRLSDCGCDHRDQVQFTASVEIKTSGWCHRKELGTAKEDFIKTVKRELYGDIETNVHRALIATRYADRDEIEAHLQNILTMIREA